MWVPGYHQGMGAKAWWLAQPVLITENNGQYLSIPLLMSLQANSRHSLLATSRKALSSKYMSVPQEITKL